MSRRAIAPVLTAYIEKRYEFEDGWKAKARAELRALKAVVRAAREIFDPDDHEDPALYPEWRRLDRALTALARAQGRK